MKKEKLQNIIVLSIIILIGLFFRFRHWPDYLTFDYEKSRDAIASQNIYLTKKLTLLGPTTEVDGIFHGPVYYYLVGFCYFFFKGDPRAGSIVSFLFNISCIPILYFIGKDLFNRKVGLLAGFLYAVSFEAISYAYWLSNPGPSVPFIFLMFYFFYKFCVKADWFLIFSLLCLGIAIQFQILNVIFIVPLVLMYFVLGKPKINLKEFFFSVLAFFMPIFSFGLFELKHNFLMTTAFINNYFSANKTKSSFSFNPSNYLTRITKETADIFFPTTKPIGIIIFLVLISFILIKLTKQKENKIWKFLLIWIFSTLPIFLINSRMSESSAAFIGISGALIIAFSAIIVEILPKKLFLATLLLVFLSFLSNFHAIDYYLTDCQKRLFDFNGGLFLKTDLDIINYTYKEANGADFKIDTITSPLDVSHLWDYLYEWYARKYSLRTPSKDVNTKIQFFIIESIYVVDVSGSEIYKKNVVRIKKQDIADLEKKIFFSQVEVQKWISKTKEN